MSADPDATVDPAPGPLEARAADAEGGGAHASARRFVVEGEYARGAMGRVLLAYDRDLSRTVALKTLARDDDTARRRFQREARLTARLQHPSIVPVYELGVDGDGRPFYAMRLVRGRTLAAAATTAKDLAERLALVPSLVALCDAVAYAHGQSVVHRDLKPDNVLLGDFGETVVIDWGLARDLGARDDDAAFGEEGPVDAELTAAGSLIGTPQYMAPEQVEGAPADRRSDVYALGATLHFALSGEAPHGGDVLSDVLYGRARGRPRPLEERAPGVPTDLAVIVRKALAERPGDRYPSAKELAEDLRRFQTGQLVSARNYSAWALASRWVSRHGPLVATALGAAALLATVGAVSVRRVVRERDRAEAASRAARQSATERLLAQARGALGYDPTLAVALLRRWTAEGGGGPVAQELVSEAEAKGVARHVFPASMGEVSAAAFAGDGGALWVAASDGAELRAMSDGAVRARVSGLGVLALLPLSGGRMAAHTRNQGFVLLDATRGASRALPGAERSAAYASTFDGGRWLLQRLVSGAVRASDGLGRSVLIAEGAAEVRGAASRARVAVLDASGALRVCDVGAACSARWAHPGAASLAISADGLWVATGGADGRVRVGGADGAGEAVEYAALGGGVRGLRFDPSGRWVAAWGHEDGVHLRAREGAREHRLRGHGANVVGFAFAPDAPRAASVASDGTARRWAWEDDVVEVLRGQVSTLDDPIFSPDGALMVTLSREGEARVWSARTQGRRLLGHDQQAYGVAWVSPTALVTVADDLTGRRWHLPTGEGSVLFRARGRLRLQGSACARTSPAMEDVMID